MLNLSQTTTGDAQLAHIKGLTGLKGLNLNFADVGDAGLAEALFADFHEQRSFEVSGITMDIRQRYDARSGRLHTEYTFTRDGHRDTRIGSQRVYSAGELCRMLEHSGFKVEALYGGLDRREFAIGSPHLVAVYVLQSGLPNRAV